MKNKLRSYRRASRITQEALAKMVNVSRQTINSIEKGKYDPSLRLAFKLAIVFGTTIEDLFHSEF